MILPNGERAIVDIAKLRDYCLNDGHPEGRHKARVFRSALGLASPDAAILRDALLDAARVNDAQPGLSDFYGQRFVLDFRMRHAGRDAMVRAAWIIRAGEDAPRLTSCYVL
ncbi:DUF6883 domain-containing protein [Thermithiobacillus plumbiphilus]|uniref:DUF6883 domain-containing protein n=1 Tax=Thermithiobacillus plumbiphilus TaxID=1729899 RepID=A0ABU9D8P3_9PROT